jgi:dTDP-4-amino-4,6-dideoxygalactose transaminase
VKRLRNGGQTDQYHHVEFGVNSRLDEMQAAILRARLRFLPRWTDQRRALAGVYRCALKDGPAMTIPPECDPGHVYHLFTVLSGQREDVRQKLKAAGIETLIHYPMPIPNQPALARENPDRCPVAERVCAEVFSLPLYPALPKEAVIRIAEVLSSAVRAAGRPVNHLP